MEIGVGKIENDFIDTYSSKYYDEYRVFLL
ncbi:MAG: hypothetical protein ACI9IL_000464 [Rickettsiales bacterium]|jgi:hypothetical protein